MRSMVSGGLVAISGLMLCAPLSAQITPTFGIEGGLNFSKINLEASGVTVSFKSRTGFAVGAFLQAPLGPSLTLEPHVLYSQQGTKFDDGGSASATIKLDYIHIPVLFKYSFPMPSSPASPFVVAGPYLGIKAGCKVKFEDDGSSISGDCDETDENNFKSTDFGLSFGAGVNFQKLILTVRYALGLTSIAEETDESDPDASAKNRVLSILVGFRI